jgi:hypothetical protein
MTNEITEKKRTAPAAISLAFFAWGWYSGDTMLSTDSIEVFIISEDITHAQQINTAAHSVTEIPNMKDAAMMSIKHIAIIRRLRPALSAVHMPRKACLNDLKNKSYLPDLHVMDNNIKR